MRHFSQSHHIREFMKSLDEMSSDFSLPLIRCYFSGGGTAVLMGWRESTIDIDIFLTDDKGQDASGPYASHIEKLKNKLQINIEFASPLLFIPVSHDWQKEAIYIQKFQRVAYFHFPLVYQLISKILRGYETDLQDAHNIIEHQNISQTKVLERVIRLKDQWPRYNLSFEIVKSRIENFFETHRRISPQ